ncbi:MAG: hypothetical protein PF637_08105 [Spirochaetes bacterium]|jgi:antitoxin component YwqK of YwqJK toxin-antitoxin module|nr:hypothetical protein [Spirochaetota bacterium]
MKIRKILSLILIMVLTVFLSCEIEEEPQGGASEKLDFRIAAVNVNGTVTDTYSETYSYNDRGYLSMRIVKDSEGNTQSITSFEYSSEGLLTKKVTTSGGTTIVAENEYDKNRRVRSTMKDQNEIITGIVNFYYDERGRITKKEEKDASGQINGSADYLYEDEAPKGIAEDITLRILKNL